MEIKYNYILSLSLSQLDIYILQEMTFIAIQGLWIFSCESFAILYIIFKRTFTLHLTTVNFLAC